MSSGEAQEKTSRAAPGSVMLRTSEGGDRGRNLGLQLAREKQRRAAPLDDAICREAMKIDAEQRGGLAVETLGQEAGDDAGLSGAKILLSPRQPDRSKKIGGSAGRLRFYDG